MGFTDSFRTARWVRTLNLLLQAALFLALFGGLNYLARDYAWRFDLTAGNRYSLSPETLAYLRNLQRPVRIVVTFTADASDPTVAQAYRDISGLLREYTFATENNPNGRITTQFLDVYSQRLEADRLGLDEPDAVFLFCGDQRQRLLISDLYDAKDRHEYRDFRGEQAVTAAILSVSNPRPKKIYFLAGNGEMRPDDVDPRQGLSTLADELRLRNYAIGRLQLSTARQIPDDAALLIAAAPRGPYAPFEQELLRQYLGQRAGRFILMLAPGVRSGLDDLFYDWGVLVDDDIVYDTDPNDYTDNNDLLIRAFTPHPITQSLINYQLPLQLGLCRSVRPDPGRSLASGLQVTTLAATATTAWGKVGYRPQQGPPVFTPGVDLKGLPDLPPDDRLGIAVLSERVQTRDNLPFSVRSGRLLVIGTGDMVANSRIALPGNQSFFLNAVNWIIDRDVQLNIPPRPIERYQLSLSQRELMRLRYTLLLALPACTALLGLVVYWSRRN